MENQDLELLKNEILNGEETIVEEVLEKDGDPKKPIKDPKENGASSLEKSSSASSTPFDFKSFKDNLLKDNVPVAATTAVDSPIDAQQVLMFQMVHYLVM